MSTVSRTRSALASGADALRELLRVRAEFEEMPDLCLTVRQAARLLGVGEWDCRFLLGSLVASGFLRLTPHGYVRA